MKIFVTSLFILIAFAACRSVNSSNLATKPTQVADTIVLRQLCGFCNSKTYKQTPITKLCFCTNVLEPYTPEDSAKRTQFVSAIPSVKHLTIENPSASINKIPFKDFISLETLYIFGNDYNTDWLDDFPKELLALKTLKSIEFDGVKFKEENLKKIKQQYPHIKIIGEIDYF